ncbi:hypothetical protein EDF62_3314 [Leucobacter luti]|uniref:Uncharacterized protein n=1 Tax=Leucobacter luti TaxID=340320 RepID=A0A4R6RRT9_9MICO|nr:hypothetical protein [Leucobacter luti]TDP89561.1 hypothetical protein EDF62_3314 [Leucobacter luti]
MSNITRRQDHGLGKTASGGSGGSFASHERTTADPPPASSINDTEELDEILRQRASRLEAIADRRAALEREEADEQLELLSAKAEQLAERYGIPPGYTQIQLNPSDDNPGQYRFAGLRDPNSGGYYALDIDASDELAGFVDELGLYDTSPLFADNERYSPVLQLVDSSLPASADQQRYGTGPITQHPVSGAKSQSLAIPARQVDLEVGAAPAWPEGWSMESANFGTDDSDRFFTTWSFRDEDGETRDFIYTDYEDGADFGSEDDLPWGDPDAMDTISTSVKRAHIMMNTNSHIVGRGACEQDPALEAQVKRVSLGVGTEPSKAELDDWFRRERIANAGIERPITFSLLSPEGQREWEDMQIEALDRQGR